MSTHGIQIKLIENIEHPWILTWGDNDGSHQKQFDCFEEVSRFVEGELLA